MILGDVEEVITSVEIDDETYEEIIKVRAFDSAALHSARDVFFVVPPGSTRVIKCPAQLEYHV